MKRSVVGVVAMVVGLPSVARADDAAGTNVMVGPVLGLRLGGPPGSRLIVGVEGGGGWGPERINLGFTRRLDKTFVYGEVDLWYIVGVSFGAGVDSDGNESGVVGLWEGVPIKYPTSCGIHEWESVVTISVGYRYTGVHELYVAPKAGAIYDGAICFD